MRPLSLARVLFALLAFQLAAGLQVGVASAVVAQKADSHAACPEHAQRSAVDVAHPGSAHPDSAHPTAKLAQHQLAHGSSNLKHDCCKSSGCQCHCGNLPLAVNFIAIRAVPDSSPARAVPITCAVSAPADNLFRPPIAS